jgi:multiple sugar transport system substrate-binding protein
MRFKHSASVMALALLITPLAACGGDDSSSSSGGDNPAFKENVDSKGPITYVQGKDNTGVVKVLIDKWNSEHPDEKVTVKEQTDEANQQHDDLVRNLDAKNADYDVMSVDLVWTAEFAAKGYLQPLEDKMAIKTDGVLEPVIASGNYNDTQYAAPQTSDGGMLYYRTDLVKTPPKSWDEMMGMCDIAKKNNIDCYAGQFAKYEGLTVNASEAINGAGGQIVDASGKATVDSPESVKGLDTLVQAYADGNIPKAAVTYKEEESRLSFQNGKLLFMRQWPYAYNLAETEGSSKIKGKFAVAPLVGLDGPGTSSLGGHNNAVSAYSDHKATAIAFVNWIMEEEQQRTYVEKGGNAPVIESLYSDPALVKKYAYLPVLLESIKTAVPRPITPFYPAVSKAITDNSYAAMRGEKSAEDAIKDMQAAIEAASK